MVTKIVRALLLPVRRARAIRNDDQAQVLVLTSVMVFVVTIMAITTFNAGTLLYNRVRVQNAADAAADSFAAYQARGLNLAQHLNDIHYDANWIFFVAESLVFTVRITCPAWGIEPPPIFYNWFDYRDCCRDRRNDAEDLDDIQHGVSELILGIQAGINIVFPILGIINANGLAEANGAGKLWNIIGDALAPLARLFLLPEAIIKETFKAIANIPYLGDIYVLPTKLDQIFDLNIAKKDPDPNSLPWDTKGIVRGLAVVSDVACVASGDYATWGGNEPDHDWGWRDDTFFCGGPSYNTWVVGMEQRNAFPGVERLAWLNPRMRAREQRVDMYSHQRKYGVFKNRRGIFSLTRFRNPVTLVMASSQVEGAPVMERSGHSDFGPMGGYSTPHLISVHMGEPGSDSDPTSMLIWH